MGTDREIVIAGRYLLFPIRNEAPKRLVRLLSEGRLVHEAEMELADDGRVDFWAPMDVRAYLGRSVTITIDGTAQDGKILDRVEQGDTLKHGGDLYRETYRPRFHFTSRRGWINDPNGLFYYDGEYHLFYQHNPYGVKWGNMHWGHAVSTDLVHWRELGEALHPDESGTMFSGSGVVDEGNTTGWQVSTEKPLVLVYTAAGGTAPRSRDRLFTQCLAYSTDRGRTWTKYALNPVLGHLVAQNRDPKVCWHEATGQWVMALYLDGSTYGLFSSPDLKRWQQTDEVELPGCSECPDLFPLAVDGRPDQVKWVFWAANTGYRIGSFDGQRFLPETGVLYLHTGTHCYAAQTWNGIPRSDGRRIQIGWANLDLPGMPFNGYLTFPCELTLRRTDEGLRLCAQPVREIAKLHGNRHCQVLNSASYSLPDVAGDLFDLQVEWALGTAKELGVSINGVPVTYDTSQQTLSCLGGRAVMPPVDGRINLRILVDRVSLEVFGNDGRVYMSCGVIPEDGRPDPAVWTRGGTAEMVTLRVTELLSALREDQ